MLLYMLHRYIMSNEKGVFVELWKEYKDSIESAQDALKLQLCNDVVETIASFTTWKKIEPRQFVDVLDTVYEWYVSIIMQIGQTKDGKADAFIHYCNWSRIWDEWIPIDSDRIQPLGTHTRGIPYLGYSIYHKYAWFKSKDFKLSCGSNVSHDEGFGIVIKYRHPKVHVRFHYCDRWVNIDELNFCQMPSEDWHCGCGNLNKNVYYKTLTDNFPGLCRKCGSIFKMPNDIYIEDVD